MQNCTNKVVLVFTVIIFCKKFSSNLLISFYFIYFIFKQKKEENYQLQIIKSSLVFSFFVCEFVNMLISWKHLHLSSKKLRMKGPNDDLLLYLTKNNNGNIPWIQCNSPVGVKSKSSGFISGLCFRWSPSSCNESWTVIFAWIADYPAFGSCLTALYLDHNPLGLLNYGEIVPVFRLLD